MNAIDIVRQVAREHGITADVLRSRANPIKLFPVRREAIRRIHAERGLSLNQIGLLFAGREHTTILGYISDARRARHVAQVRAHWQRTEGQRT